MSEIDSTAEQICVGDIIVLTEDDVVPCDAVILSTSNDSHQVMKSCFAQYNHFTMENPLYIRCILLQIL